MRISGLRAREGGTDGSGGLPTRPPRTQEGWTGFRSPRVELSLLVFLAVGVFLGGCGIGFKQPTANSTILSPVTVIVQWSSDLRANTLSVKLDNIDITPQFTVDLVAQEASARLSMAPGTHTLGVRGDVLQTFYNQYETRGEDITFTAQGPPPPPLNLSPSSLTVSAGDSGTITIDRGTSTGSPITVTLHPSNATVALGTRASGTDDTIDMAIGESTRTDAIKGVLAGQVTITASATGYQSASMTANVDPVLTYISPPTAPAGYYVTLLGDGFVTGATAQFANTSASTTFVYSDHLEAMVPQGLSGTVNVQVQAAGRSSRPVSFIVQPALVFRSSNMDVQSFDFTTPSTPRLIDTKAATGSTGGLTSVVGLSLRYESGYLFRTSSSDLQVFSVSPSGVLAPVAQHVALSSNTGAGVWAAGTTIIRASDLGIQAFEWASGNLQAKGTLTTRPSVTGVAVDVAAEVAVRALNTGIEAFDISNVSSLSLTGSNYTGRGSTTGVDVKLYAPWRAVRAHDQGIEVYDVPSLSFLGSGTGFGSTTGVAVAVSQQLHTRAVRAYNEGIEVYDISSPASIRRLGFFKSTATSTTGVGVYVIGNMAYRTTNAVIEAYNITDPSSIILKGSSSATGSTTGVAIGGQ